MCVILNDCTVSLQDIAKLARQNMVARLDYYEKHLHDIFIQASYGGP